MKTGYIQLAILACLIFANKVSAQTIPSGVPTVKAYWHNPRTFWAPEGGGYLIKCENTQNTICAIVYGGYKDLSETFRQWVGEGNTMVGVCDNPENRNAVRYIITKDNVRVEELSGGAVQLTLYPPVR